MFLRGPSMSNEFVVLRRGEFETYTNYDDIPLDFDHVIKFLPEVPLGPHSDDEHIMLEQWNAKLQRLLEIEHQNNLNKLTIEDCDKYTYE